jgi:Protein of unknown function (DUF3604)
VRGLYGQFFISGLIWAASPGWNGANRQPSDRRLFDRNRFSEIARLVDVGPERNGGVIDGLKMEAELGVNPYKFGLVGSTDAHTALAAVEEDNFFGKTASSEPSLDG